MVAQLEELNIIVGQLEKATNVMVEAQTINRPGLRLVLNRPLQSQFIVDHPSRHT